MVPGRFSASQQSKTQNAATQYPDQLMVVIASYKAHGELRTPHERVSLRLKFLRELPIRKDSWFYGGNHMMSHPKKLAHFDPEPGSDFPMVTPYLWKMTQSYFEWWATATNTMMNGVLAQQRNLSQSSSRLISFCPPGYSASSAAMLDMSRRYFELILKSPMVSTSLLTEMFSKGSIDTRSTSGRRTTIASNRRSSAVVIKFPDRRKTVS